MANRMTPPAEGQEKTMLLVLDKQQGKVSAVKGYRQGRQFADRATHYRARRRVHAGGQEQRCVQQLHFQLLPQVSDTSGLELFSVKASQVEQNAKAIEDNHRNPTPEGGKRAEMLRVPKPDFHEFKQGYRFDPSKSTGRT